MFISDIPLLSRKTVTCCAGRRPVFWMTITTVFGSTSANPLLRDVDKSSSQLNAIRADSTTISTSSVVTPSSLVIRTVTVTCPSLKVDADVTANARSRMFSFAIVVTPFIGLMIHPSGRLSNTSYVKESSPLPLLLMVMVAVVLPPGATPTVEETSVTLKP